MLVAVKLEFDVLIGVGKSEHIYLTSDRPFRAERLCLLNTCCGSVIEWISIANVQQLVKPCPSELWITEKSALTDREASLYYLRIELQSFGPHERLEMMVSNPSKHVVRFKGTLWGVSPGLGG